MPRRRVAGERGHPRAAVLTPVRTPAIAPAIAPVRTPAIAPVLAPVLTATETLEEPAAPARNATSSARSPGWLVAGLALFLASTALVASAVLWRGAQDHRNRASDQSAAMSSARATVEKMLGYDYKGFDRHTAEVSALLTGSFKAEFVRAATEVVKPLAVQNQAVVQAEVSKVSVMSTPGPTGVEGHDDTVRILAFVNQSTTSAKLQGPQIDQNRVILTMSQVEGRWLVARVEAF